MARRVAWTETAWRDLERVADYIAEDSPGYAAAIVRRIRDAASSLEELAERGRVVPELGDARVAPDSADPHSQRGAAESLSRAAADAIARG